MCTASQRLMNVRTLVHYVSEWITLINERSFVLRPVWLWLMTCVLNVTHLVH